MALGYPPERGVNRPNVDYHNGTLPSARYVYVTNKSYMSLTATVWTSAETS